MEVNASPFSEKIYEKLGFKKVDELQEINGIQFVSMKYDIRNNPS
jgi:predicted GNAT family N-acyltransferase